MTIKALAEQVGVARLTASKDAVADGVDVPASKTKTFAAVPASPAAQGGGFPTKDDTVTELGRARELLGVAAPGDTQTASRIADAITAAVRATGQLSDHVRVRRAVGGGRDPAVKPPTVGEWLEEWLASKKKLRPGTVRSWNCHTAEPWSSLQPRVAAAKSARCLTECFRRLSRSGRSVTGRRGKAGDAGCVCDVADA